MTERATQEPGGSPRRGAVGDGLLSLVLVLVSSLVGIPLLALVAFGVPSLGASRVEMLAVPCLLVGSALAGWIFRGWPSGRLHSRAWLTLSAVLGSLGAYFTGMALGPWPDLLSDEVLSRGQLAFILEAAKVVIPWLAGSVVAFVALRYESARARTRR
jgi:hypothetical protein